MNFPKAALIASFAFTLSASVMGGQGQQPSALQPTQTTMPATPCPPASNNQPSLTSHVHQGKWGKWFNKKISDLTGGTVTDVVSEQPLGTGSTSTKTPCPSQPAAAPAGKTASTLPPTAPTNSTTTK